MKRLLFTFFALYISGISTAQYWNFDAKNVPPSSERNSNAFMGNAVAINDQYAIVGVPGYSSSFFGYTAVGTAAVYEKNGAGVWVSAGPLYPNITPQNFDQAGMAVALEGNIAVLGAPFANDGTKQNCGRIDIYARDALGWKYQISHYGTNANDNLGQSLTMKDGRIYAGAPNYNNGQGYVRIYNQNSFGSWTLETTLTGISGANRFFGAAIAAKDSTVFVGVPGLSQVFRYEKGATWPFAFDQVIYGYNISQANNFFGSAMAMDDSLLVIGAAAHNNNEGLACALRPNTTTGDWGIVDTIYNPSPDTDDYFGAQISVYNNKIVIATPEETTDENETNPLNDAGAAFIYYDWNNNSKWSLFQKIVSPDRDSMDRFAQGVSLWEDDLLIGAPREDLDSLGQNFVESAGAAYFYKSCNNYKVHNLTSCGSTSFYGSSFNQTGQYMVTSPSPVGCDSVQILNLTVPTYTGTETRAICEPYLWGNDTYYTNTTVLDTLQTPEGCDSVSTITLNINPNWNESYTHSDGNNAIILDTDIDGDFAVTSFFIGGTTTRYIKIFQKINGAWNSIQTINNNSGRFGANVEINGDFIAVSADTFAQPDSYTHKVFVYKKGAGNSWSHYQTIQNQSYQQNNPQGKGGLALEGDHLVIGLPYYDYATTVNKYGIVKIYNHQTTQFNYTQQIDNPDYQNGADGEFGFSVDIEGDRMAIGHPGKEVNTHINAGKVYVYQYGGNWSPLGSITNSDAKDGDRLGSDVAVIQGMVAVGFSGRTYTVGSGPSSYTGTSGGARLFKKNTSNNNWTQTANIGSYASGYFQGSSLGLDLDADGELLVVSDRNKTFQSGITATAEGDIRLYLVDPSGTLTQLDQLRTIDETEQFGRAVAISDGKIVSLASANISFNSTQILYVHEVSPYELNKSYQASCDAIPWYGQSADTDGTYIDTTLAGAGCNTINVLIADILGETPVVSLSNGSLSSNIYYDQNAGDYFQWVDCNNNFTVVGYGDSYTPTGTGNYAIITYKGNSNCTDTSTCFVVTKVENIQDTEMIKAYPNPTTGQVTLDLGQHYNQIQIKVSTVTGQIVQELFFDNQQQLNINLNSMPGVYFLQLQSEDKYLGSLKILKQ
ncbi:MAG: T9SS type A sorting domain-containing protein [Aureispira sp.]|nr:T9SS type A sorting domain-containing protein [Aureispira sp.]